MLDVLDLKFLMSDLLEYNFHLNRVVVFIFARNEHGCHADDVEIGDLTHVLLTFEVAIKQAHSEEEGLIVALKVGEDLDHPVDHAGA